MITISPVKGSVNKYSLVRSVSFDVSGVTYIIPEGFEFDGASIPRFFWSYIGHPFSPRFVKASLIHDYMCNGQFDRKIADRKFKELLKEAGVPSWKASIMYSAVRGYAKLNGL